MAQASDSQVRCKVGWEDKTWRPRDTKDEECTKGQGKAVRRCTVRMKHTKDDEGSLCRNTKVSLHYPTVLEQAC